MKKLHSRPRNNAKLQHSKRSWPKFMRESGEVQVNFDLAMKGSI